MGAVQARVASRAPARDQGLALAVALVAGVAVGAPAEVRAPVEGLRAAVPLAVVPLVAVTLVVAAVAVAAAVVAPTLTTMKRFTPVTMGTPVRPPGRSPQPRWT
jgi:hypothetical protein